MTRLTLSWCGRAGRRCANSKSAAQRQGLGRRLWDTARADCIAASNRGTFTVNSSNNAIAIYERLGFVRCGPAVQMDGVFYNPMSMQNAA
jgi:predicted GNAT family N-acyltransferase